MDKKVVCIFLIFSVLLFINIENKTVLSKHSSNNIKKSINFFNKSISFEFWKNHQNDLDYLLNNGKWINAWHHQEFQPIYNRPCTFEHPYIFKYYQGNCFNSLGFTGYHYLWQPKSIKKNNVKSHLSNHVYKSKHLHMWSAEKMCKILNGRNILFFGDSIQNELYFDFVSSMVLFLLINIYLIIILFILICFYFISYIELSIQIIIVI
jgi:hypothetical protein